MQKALTVAYSVYFSHQEFIGSYSTEEININYPDPAVNFVGHQVSFGPSLIIIKALRIYSI